MGPLDRFSLTVDLVDDTVLVHVCGELDVATAPQLTEAVDPWLGTVGDLVFDFGALQFIDSSGLAALARLLHGDSRPRVVIRRPSAMVRRVLEISQLATLVTVEG